VSYLVNDAVAQVKARLAEHANTTVAALETGAGGAATISSDAQIVIFLSEGARELVKQGALELWGDGTYSPGAGTKKVLYTSFTMTTVGQVFWRPTAGTWNSVAIQVCDRRWFEVHNPTLESDSTATPERFYVDIDGVLLAPRPVASQVLRLAGLVLPRDQVAGGNVLDVPDHLVPAMVYWAAWQVATKQAGRSEALAAIAPAMQASWFSAIGKEPSK
jgi:hypothetical protein